MSQFLALQRPGNSLVLLGSIVTLNCAVERGWPVCPIDVKTFK